MKEFLVSVGLKPLNYENQARTIIKKTNSANGHKERSLYYYTAGENTWKLTNRWPPEGTRMQRFYLAENAVLDSQPPQGRPPQDKQKDTYRVNYKAGTGTKTRWSTQNARSEVSYGNRAEADKLLLTYTSSPLDNAIEITGHPVIYLQMTSTETDGAVIVYLEDVAPDGSVTMLTEGELRLIHRKISTEEPPYPQFGPYHTFERKDALPMQPGEVAEVSFALLPLSVRVKAGHALRVAIAGHDKDSFERVLEQATPTYEFYRNTNFASFIDIPIVPENASVIANPFEA
jgi:putative CocE/NonD family hydrolase